MYKTNTIQCLGNSNKEPLLPLKTTGQHSFFNQKNKKEGHDKCSKSSGEIRCQLAAFSHHALFLWWGGTGPDHPLCSGAFHFYFFLRCSIFLLFLSLIFFFIVLRCETVSPSGRSTHSVREKRVTFSSKTSSGNIKPCDQRKKMHKF